MRAIAFVLLVFLGGCLDQGDAPTTSEEPAPDPPEDEPLCIDDRYRPTPCPEEPATTPFFRS